MVRTVKRRVAVHHVSVGLPAPKECKPGPLRYVYTHHTLIGTFSAYQVYSHLYPCQFHVHVALTTLSTIFENATAPHCQKTHF